MNFACIRSVRRLAWLATLTLAAFVVLAGVQQATASAQVAADRDFWKGTAERRATVNRLVYGQSPQPIPTSYDPVREAEEILRERQRTLPPSNPQAQSLWRQIRGLTVKTALSTAPRALGTIGLAVGAFEIGWKIGSGINAKFLKLGLPEAIPHTATDFRGNGFGQMLVWHSAGFKAESFGKVVQPVDGFTWTRLTAHGNYSYWRTGAPEVTCDHNRVAPPLGVTIHTASVAGKDCGYGEDRAGTEYHVAYVTEDDFGAPAPIEPYTNQPYSTSKSAPTPPAQTTVEQAIDTELDKPENDLLRDWLNYQLGSPASEDPLGIGEPRPDIDFPEREEKWEQHDGDFPVPHPNADEYWRDAADVIRKTEDGWPDFEKCRREHDNADIYWDPERQAIVIVRDGAIQNFYIPTNPDDPGDAGYARRYFDSQCGT